MFLDKHARMSLYEVPWLISSKTDEQLNKHRHNKSSKDYTDTATLHFFSALPYGYKAYGLERRFNVR